MNGLAMVYKMMKNKEKKIMLLVLTSIGKILRFHTRRGGELAIEKLQLWWALSLWSSSLGLYKAMPREQGYGGKQGPRWGAELEGYTEDEAVMEGQWD